MIFKDKPGLKPLDFDKHALRQVLLVACAVAGAALWLRHGVLEAGLLPRDCTSGGEPLLCLLKDALVQGFMHQRVGWLSLAAGSAAFVLGCRRLAWLGWVSGLLGLVFYSYDPAAVGTLLSLLVLVAAQRQHRHGERKAA
ncbi:hypothetical protein TMEC54S_02330 [Thauera mechernichensis]